MYRVKGADQKEYGPISAEQVQQWIRENRLNRFSLAEKDGEPGWKPLDQFPEFSGSLGPTAISGPAAADSALAISRSTREAALAAVKSPAIALIVWGWIFIAMALWGIVGSLLGNNAAKQEELIKQMDAFPAGPMKEFMLKVIEAMMTYGVILNLLTLVMGIVVAVGAMRMMRLKSLPLAWASAILVVQPCINPCCCIPLAFGIWAIVVLAKSEVRNQFE